MDSRIEERLRQLAADHELSVLRIVNGVIETTDGKFYQEVDGQLCEISREQAQPLTDRELAEV